VRAFIEMMRKWESQVAVVADERATAPAAAATSPAASPTPSH